MSIRTCLAVAICGYAMLLLNTRQGARVSTSSADFYRPVFHFSPEKNWTNDPNGLVFDGSEYHLFYQYNPFGNLWGHMSWGHAVSKDLVSWQELPVALPEEKGVMIFSGSAVVDWANTTGFGTNGVAPVIAIYTGHRPGLQTQNLAYSVDHGRTWNKYQGNPVIDINQSEFRDPMVFWHEPSHRWVMVVSLAKDHKVRFYSSPNMKTWTKLSDFGPAGATGVPNWECPNVFPLSVANQAGSQKWVLAVGVGDGGPAGGSATQYFVGEFDGTNFINDNPADKTLWIDHGPDFYAAQTWSDIPASDGRRIMLAWMDNWKYADKLPTSPWRGQMTFPRTLGLLETKDGIRLTQAPVREIESIRGERFRVGSMGFAAAAAELSHHVWPDGIEIDARLKLDGTQDVGFELRKGPLHRTRVGYDANRSAVYIDRARSGNGVSPQFPGRHEVSLEIQNGIIQFDILVDRSSVELFANEGRVAITDLIFPDLSDKGLSTYYSGNPPQIISLEVWKLNAKQEER